MRLFNGYVMNLLQIYSSVLMHDVLLIISRLCSPNFCSNYQLFYFIQYMEYVWLAGRSGLKIQCMKTYQNFLMTSQQQYSSHVRGNLLLYWAIGWLISLMFTVNFLLTVCCAKLYIVHML